jgi:ribose/xylose/arabinose/galactoside ABC-type transport system permease subunit
MNNRVSFLLQHGFYLFFVLLLIVGSIVSPIFLTGANINQILFNASSILILSAGVTILIITGNMDLSIGSIAFIGMSVASVLQKTGASFGLMITVALAIGLICGLINGGLVALCGLNSMLTTLGMMIALRGVSLLITGGGTEYALLPAFKQMASASVLSINVITIVSLLIILLLQLVLKRTKFGIYCYAIGCNQTAAKRLGLPVKRITMISFVITGLCAALAGIIACSKLGFYVRVIGLNMEFDIISVCVIGGTSLLGGRGNIFPGTLIGVLIFYLINNVLTLLNASPFIFPFAKGIVIFAAMYIDSLKKTGRQ